VTAATGAVLTAGLIGAYYWVRRNSEPVRPQVVASVPTVKARGQISAQPVRPTVRRVGNPPSEHDEHVLLAGTPLAQSNLNNWGDPLAKFVNGSNGNTLNGVSQPEVIHSVDVEYSGAPPKQGGTVLLSVVIDTDGNPHDIQIVRGLGAGLDEKAMETAQGWRFKPGTKNGVAVSTRAQIEVRFRPL
jgi:protein TonB